MVDIEALINGVCDKIKIDDVIVPYWGYMPVFTELEEPPNIFIVFDIDDSPEFYSCNSYNKIAYNVTINIFNLFTDLAFNNLVKTEFEKAGFSYFSGAKIGEAKDFPYRVQHYKEFKIELEEN